MEPDIVGHIPLCLVAGGSSHHSIGTALGIDKYAVVFDAAGVPVDLVAGIVAHSVCGVRVIVRIGR